MPGMRPGDQGGQPRENITSHDLEFRGVAGTDAAQGGAESARVPSRSASRRVDGVEAGTAVRDRSEGKGGNPGTVKFAIKVKHDPDKLLAGGYLADLTPRHLILHRGKKQALELACPQRPSTWGATNSG